MKYLHKVGALVASALAFGVHATPFEECPNDGFLMQGIPAELFTLDLSKEFYTSLSDDLGTKLAVNGIGFNVADNYLYGWSQKEKSLVKIGSDYQIQVLDQPSNLGQGILSKGFSVADISIAQNAYYAYRPGQGFGLYRIGLDASAEDYLVAVKIVDEDVLDWHVRDFAFHPNDGFIYSVDQQGGVWKVNPTDGTFEVIGDVGFSASFGGMFFDDESNLYFSRNNNGYVYSVNVQTTPSNAHFEMYGPKSGQNDGARCGGAGVPSAPLNTFDFGDAPASYSTLATDDGARHMVVGNSLYLGDERDIEADAYVAPNADDLIGVADDDGIQFVTPFTAGDTALVKVTSSGTGVVSMWVDWNGDGDFDTEDQVGDVPVTSGSQFVGIPVPTSAVAGTTWARFRLTNEGGIGFSGSATEGEVEDYEITLSPCDCNTAYYPYADGWVTLAYEDLWPAKGDFDMNDVVIYYRTAAIKTSAGNIVSVTIDGELAASGAGFHNGFAVKIPGVNRDQIDEANIIFRVNDESVERDVLEADRTEAIAIITPDVWQDETPMDGCSFFRTEIECDDPIDWTFSVTLPFNEGINAEDIGSLRLDPFIFGASGHERNDRYQPADYREMEVHFKNALPSEAADRAFLNFDADKSVPTSGFYYLQSNGLPFALEIEGRWKHPLEGVDIVDAYPDFVKYVLSLGRQNKDWHLPENASANKIYPHD